MNIADLFDQMGSEPKTVQHVWRTVCSIFVVQSQAEIFA